MFIGVSNLAYSETTIVELEVEINSETISDPVSTIQVSADSLLPLVFYRIENGERVDITNDPKLFIEAYSRDRVSYVNGEIQIKPIGPSELVASDDFALAMLALVYHDVNTESHGRMIVNFRISQQN